MIDTISVRYGRILALDVGGSPLFQLYITFKEAIMDKYKGISYKVMRSTFGTINVVYVIWAGRSWDFRTIKQAKSFINNLNG